MKYQYVLTGVEVLLAVGNYLQRKGAFPNMPDHRWVIKGNVVQEYTFTVEFVPAGQQPSNPVSDSSEPEKLNKLLTENIESSWKKADE